MSDEARQRVERARPLLGTVVRIGRTGPASPDTEQRVEAAFAAVAEVHDLMSFHAAGSDVTRLNGAAADGPVEVHDHTIAVITRALELAAASAGVFDISVAARLVEWGRLPRPPSRHAPDPNASWRDIEVLDGRRIRFHRPLWIDLGGIAKGYAVDQAIARLSDETQARWIVNAGGDLRVCGQGGEGVLLRTERTGDAGAPVVEVENASLASSTGRGEARRLGGRTAGPHMDGRDRRCVGARSFVSVIAKECTVADALTKIVLAAPDGARAVLEAYGATALLQGPRGGWRTLGAPGRF